MTREIKFRGKAAGEWHYGHLFAYQDANGGTGSHFIIEQNGKEKPKQVQVIPDTVGQFTGAYDKNGTPIYEGDIVRFHIYARGVNEPEYQDGVIVFEDGRFFAPLKKSTHYLFCCYSRDYEVIGNEVDCKK